MLPTCHRCDMLDHDGPAVLCFASVRGQSVFKTLFISSKASQVMLHTLVACCVVYLVALLASLYHLLTDNHFEIKFAYV